MTSQGFLDSRHTQLSQKDQSFHFEIPQSQHFTLESSQSSQRAQQFDFTIERPIQLRTINQTRNIPSQRDQEFEFNLNNDNIPPERLIETSGTQNNLSQRAQQFDFTIERPIQLRTINQTRNIPSQRDQEFEFTCLSHNQLMNNSTAFTSEIENVIPLQTDQQFEFNINDNNENEDITLPAVIQIEDISDLTLPSSRKQRSDLLSSLVTKVRNNKCFTYNTESPFSNIYFKTNSFYTSVRKSSGIDKSRLCVSTEEIGLSSLVTSESYLMVAPKKQKNNNNHLRALVTFFNEISQATLGKDFFDLLVDLFVKYRDKFIDLYGTILKDAPSLRSIVLHYNTTIPSFHSYILLQKDKLKITDQIYHEIRLRFFLENYLPDINESKEIRKNENILVLEKYNVCVRVVDVFEDIKKPTPFEMEDCDEEDVEETQGKNKTSPNNNETIEGNNNSKDSNNEPIGSEINGEQENSLSKKKQKRQSKTQKSQSKKGRNQPKKRKTESENEEPKSKKRSKQYSIVFTKNITAIIRDMLLVQHIERMKSKKKSNPKKNNSDELNPNPKKNNGDDDKDDENTNNDTSDLLEGTDNETIASYGLDRKGLHGLTVFGTSFRNSNVFNAQSPNSIIPLAVWNGPEKNIRYISTIVRKELDKLRRESVEYTYNGIVYKYKLKNILITDLCALQYLNGWKKINCPYCDCPAATSTCDHDVYERDIYETTNLLGFMYNEFVLCYLHLLERVIQHLLRISMACVVEKMKLNNLIKDIHSIPSLNNLLFEPDDNGYYNLYLTGTQCKVFLKNRSIFKEYCDTDIMILWDQGNSILNDFCNGVPSDRFDEFCINCDNFFNMFSKKSTLGSWYIHIIGYHKKIIAKTFISGLGAWSNEGFEHFHRTIEFVYEHCCQHGCNNNEYWNLLLKEITLPEELSPMLNNPDVIEFKDFVFTSIIQKENNKPETNGNRKYNGCKEDKSTIIRLTQVLVYFLRILDLSIKVEDCWNRLSLRRSVDSYEPPMVNFDNFDFNDLHDGEEERINHWKKRRQIELSGDSEIEHKDNETTDKNIFNKHFSVC